MAIRQKSFHDVSFNGQCDLQLPARMSGNYSIDNLSVSASETPLNGSVRIEMGNGDVAYQIGVERSGAVVLPVHHQFSAADGLSIIWDSGLPNVRCDLNATISLL